MSEPDVVEIPTRRDVVKGGGMIVGCGLLAGCSDDEGTGPSLTATGTPTDASTATEDGSYTVEMFPVDEVKFEAVPETWTAMSHDGWPDMAVALGQSEGCRTQNVNLDLFHDPLDIEVNTDWPSFWQESGGSWSIPKETFYEIDADVHLVDPNALLSNDWDESDIEEIETNVGPFFGCVNRRLTRGWQLERNYPEHAPSMLEAFAKLGEVFAQEERAEALLDVHAEMQAELDARMDGVDPATIGLINAGSQPGEAMFYLLDLSDPGYEMKTYRDLGVEDAFADLHDGEYGGTVDYEALLEVDPETIVVHWGIINTEDNHFDSELFYEEWVEPMENHTVGSELTAVREGRVYPGAYGEQGPIVNLFQTELTGQLLYPEQFGEFNPEQYPDVPAEYKLFDRQRVANIVNGDF